jgi:hypothetical protein
MGIMQNHVQHSYTCFTPSSLFCEQTNSDIKKLQKRVNRSYLNLSHQTNLTQRTDCTAFFAVTFSIRSCLIGAKEERKEM